MNASPANLKAVAQAQTETPEQEMARLRAENAALKAAVVSSPSRLYCKVSEKGAVSFYGLGQFPVTLYEEQWEKLLAAAEMITSFIKAAKAAGKLATPEQKAKAKELAKLRREQEKLLKQAAA